MEFKSFGASLTLIYYPNGSFTQALHRPDMMTNVDHHFAAIEGVRMHYVTAGTGEPLVLLHGWPQSWYAWRKVIGELSKKYRVIAPDMRGLGDTSRPPAGYDMKSVAGDIAILLKSVLKINSVFLAAHDWGGPAAFALAAYHPGLVRKIVMLDVAVPGDGSGTYSQGGRRWHHPFHQTLDLPEQLITGREDIYYRWFYKNYGASPTVIDEEAISEYLRTYRDFGALRAGLAYYRAVPQDVADNEAFLKDNRLQMPILAYGGGEAFGRGIETLSSMQRVGTNVSGGVMANCGHWIPEENPDFVISEMSRFFSVP
jgi:pimeloyl-ACP methyl ester carboxylesterase